MEMNTQDYLKKAILDSQERVRDFMNYSDEVQDELLRERFREFAKQEGLIAQEIQSFLNENGRA